VQGTVFEPSIFSVLGGSNGVTTYTHSFTPQMGITLQSIMYIKITCYAYLKVC
jgi:hypothetical protein